MGRAITTIGLLGVMSASTLAVSPAPIVGPSVDTLTEDQPTAPMPSHAARGVVKSVSPSSLVIVGSRRRTGEMTFVLSPATEREGEITVGSTVSVRYRPEGSTLVATAVSAHAATREAQKPETRISGR